MTSSNLGSSIQMLEVTVELEDDEDEESTSATDQDSNQFKGVDADEVDRLNAI